MEVLIVLFVRATYLGVLKVVAGCNSKQSISVFTDDVALFVKPLVHDLVAVRELLNLFGEVSRLMVNYMKTEAIVIRGGEQECDRVRDILGCQIGSFPCRYLGLQLSTGQLSRANWQPLIDRVIAFLPPWQRGLLQRSGRLILIKAVVAAKPIHHLLIAEAPDWVLEEINGWMRAFFWAGKAEINGGNCLVSWWKVCKPLQFGGLGVKDLRLQGLALRVQWEWLRRTDDTRPWHGLPPLKDPDAVAVFNSLVRIQAGEGSKVLFWNDRWLNGVSVQDIAPLVRLKVRTQCANRRTMKEAMVDHRWINDIAGHLTATGIAQCLLLLSTVAGIFRDVSQPDVFSWP